MPTFEELRGRFANAKAELRRAEDRYEDSLNYQRAYKSSESSIWEYAQRVSERNDMSVRRDPQVAADLTVAQECWRDARDKSHAAQTVKDEALGEFREARLAVSRAQDALEIHTQGQRNGAHESRREASPRPAGCDANSERCRNWDDGSEYSERSRGTTPHRSASQSRPSPNHRSRTNTPEYWYESETRRTEYRRPASASQDYPEYPPRTPRGDRRGASHASGYQSPRSEYSTYEARPHGSSRPQTPYSQSRPSPHDYDTPHTDPRRPYYTDEARPEDFGSYYRPQGSDRFREFFESQQSQRSPSPPPDYSRGRRYDSHKDDARASRDQSPPAATLAAWHSKAETALADLSVLSIFPSPPAWACGNPDCASSRGHRMLPACPCNIRKLFEGRDGLGRLRLRWHPDKFARCPEAKREAFQNMAREIFVVLDAMHKGE